MTKERLRRYQAIKAEKEQLQELLREIESRMYAPPPPQLTGMPSAHDDSGGSRQERIADSTRALRERYARKIHELDREALAIEEAIDGLDEDKRRLLRYKYIEGMTWEQVCVAMPASWSTVHRWHGQALRELREKR